MRPRWPAAATAALLALACAKPPPPAVSLPAGDPRPPALLAGLAARSGRVEAVRGLLKLAVDGPDGSLRSRQVVVAARPARLRVEILGFLSQTEALLVTDGERYAFFNARERSFEEGPLHAGLLAEIAGIDLEPAEAVDVLLGAPPLEALRAGPAALLPDGGIQVVLLDAEGRLRRAVEFDAAGALRRLGAWDAVGAPAFEARYADTRDVDAVAFAHRIDIDFPASGVRARIDLSRVALNPPLAPALFELPEPPGAAEGGG